MIKRELQTETCLSCEHFDFCMIHRGIDCKRQGGNKIPRMKTTPVEARKNINHKQKSKKLETSKKQFVEIFEPIRTKTFNW